jgi:uncharacterized protein
MRKIIKTPYYSKRVGELPRGCQYCVKGEKLVLFITGICERSCYYCALSDQKRNKDFVYADEWKIESKQDVIAEAHLIDAKGAGISGGDPLVKLDRTVYYIRLLKKEFGRKFHIHLYTPLNLVNELKLKHLSAAGLDEIRFHPDLDNPSEWDILKLAAPFSWDVGIEIPVIPHKKKETIALIRFIAKIKKINFINLNELEVSDTNCNKLVSLGFKTKDDVSYAIKGSEQMAHELLKEIQKTKLNAHYCSAKLKDKVQLANRIKRRAENVAQKYDIVNEDGTLLRGALYLKKFVPSFNYRLKLEYMDKREMNRKLHKLKRELKYTLKIPHDLIEVDEDKVRILIASWLLSDNIAFFKEKKLVPALVEEYPTHDQLEISIDFL